MSELGEAFATTIQEINYQVKKKLYDNSLKCKSRVDLSRRDYNFEVGDLVLAHFRKEIFPKGKYNKLNFKKIGLCRVLKIFLSSAYDLNYHLELEFHKYSM